MNTARALAACIVLVPSMAWGADKVSDEPGAPIESDRTRAESNSVPSENAGENCADSIVRLKSGAYFKGNIIESIPDDHVKILLPDGSTRSEKTSDVAYAGPIKSDPQSGVQSPRNQNGNESTREGSKGKHHPDEVEIRVRSEAFGVRLWARNVDTDGDLVEVCRIPCRTHMVRGHYRFGMSKQDDEPYVTNAIVEIARDSTINVQWVSARSRRIGGWIVFGLGMGTGVSALAAAASMDATDEDSKSTRNLLYGASFAAFSVGALGLILGLNHDDRNILFLDDAREKQARGNTRDTLRVWGDIGPAGLQIAGQF